MRRLLLVAKLALVAVLAVVSTGAPSRPANAAIDPEVASRVMPAAVQVGVVVDVTREGATNRQVVGLGSGTVIDARGYVLTNNHVVDTAGLKTQFSQYPGVALVEGLYAISISERPEAPPQPRFIAEIASASPEYDLAVLKVVQDVSGNPVDQSSLNLPFVEVGDSNAVTIGSAVHIFGYPGVGGDTITYTEGTISGFEELNSAAGGGGGRGWIKTDAGVSGGNSGGTGVDAAGKLIGVPTGAGHFDCRPATEDANGDGKVDKNDPCVPIGATVNFLRPVELARPLIEQALTGVTPAPNPNPPAPGPGPQPPDSEAPAADEGAVQASMLTTEDIPAGSTGAGIKAVEETSPAFAQNGGLRAASQQWSGQAPLVSVFDFRWQFPSPEQAATFLAAEKENLSEAGAGLKPATDVQPVGENGLAYSGQMSLGGITTSNYNFLFTTGNLVAKVFVGGSGELQPATAQQIAQSAQNRMALATGSTAQSQQPPAQPGSNTGGTFGPITFGTGTDAEGNPQSPGKSFPSGTARLVGFYDYSGMQDGAPYRVTWLVNGATAVDQEYQWNLGESGAANNELYKQDGTALPDGSYELRLSMGGQQVQAATATIGTGTQPQTPQQPPADGVRITGTLVDAVSGKPIPGARFIVLRKGLEWSAFQNTEGEILESVSTDPNGAFQTTVPLERGTTYSVGATASGYQLTVGTLDIAADDPAVLQLQPIGLTAEGQ